MKKRLFLGLSLFVMLFTLVAWQYASAELVELEKQPDLIQNNYTEAA